MKKNVRSILVCGFHGAGEELLAALKRPGSRLIKGFV
jgi:hypothetical protein